MLQIFSAIGSFLGGPITAITGQLFGSINNAQVQKTAQYQAMTDAQKTEHVEALKSEVQVNQAKVANNATRAGQIMVFVFGLPPAIYIGSIFITAAFPWLGLHADPLKGDLGKKLIDYAETIGLSFFVYTPAMLLTSWVKAR